MDGGDRKRKRKGLVKKKRKREKGGGGEHHSTAPQRLPKAVHVSVLPIISPEQCATIIAACETVSGWAAGGADRNRGYSFATADVEVDQHPIVRGAVTAGGVLAAAVNAQFNDAHGGTSIFAMDDCFVVKYDAAEGGQRGLTSHVDGGDLSFMVALSDRADYAGGGQCVRCASTTAPPPSSSAFVETARVTGRAFHQRPLIRDLSAYPKTSQDRLTHGPPAESTA